MEDFITGSSETLSLTVPMYKFIIRVLNDDSIAKESHWLLTRKIFLQVGMPKNTG